MQGFLYAEQDPGDSNEDSFVRRYFFSFPFCGLRWFYEAPIDMDINKLVTDDERNGWVFGGTCKVNKVTPENEITTRITQSNGRKKDISLYAFCLLVDTPAFGEIRIRLATATTLERDEWINEITYCLDIQNYLYACNECEGSLRDIKRLSDSFCMSQLTSYYFTLLINTQLHLLD